MTLYHFYALVAGVSPVAVHYESDMARDGTCFEYAKENALDAIDCIVTKPDGAFQKGHYWGVEGWATDREGVTAASLRALRFTADVAFGDFWSLAASSGAVGIINSLAHFYILLRNREGFIPSGSIYRVKPNTGTKSFYGATHDHRVWNMEHDCVTSTFEPS